MYTIKGSISNIIYKAEHSKFKIAKFKLSEETSIELNETDSMNFSEGETITIKGGFTFSLKDIEISILGTWGEDSYGTYFRVSEILETEELTEKLVEAAILRELNENIESGNTFVKESEVTEYITSAFSINEDELANIYQSMTLGGTIVSEFELSYPAIYKKDMYDTEWKVARDIKRILDEKVAHFNNWDTLDFSPIEKRMGINFSENQKVAIKASLQSKISVITGGPGTGKTTIINGIYNILKEVGNSVVIAAPTGRAAKRIQDNTSLEAVTIHRLLEATVNEKTNVVTFGRDKDDPLEYDVIIIDEASMIDINLMEKLLDATVSETKLVLVGDCNQLPSVGAGDVLRDIIDSGSITSIRLTEIYRQNNESGIIPLAHHVNSGKLCDLSSNEYPDVIYIPISDDSEIIDQILEITSTEDVQLLTPQKAKTLGIENLNKVLQKHLNPLENLEGELQLGDIFFRCGDRVMQTKNNYMRDWTLSGADVTGRGIYNGDMGIISSLDDFNNTVTITFDDGKISRYEFENLEELSLAYAITVHKSQGSEFNTVIIPVTKSISAPLKTRNLIYTAITRARKKVYIIGSQDVFNQMVFNNTSGERQTTLKERINKILKV